MGTARDLINRSLRLIGVVAEGETPSAPQQQDALEALNSLLDSWSGEGLMIHKRVREVFPLTVNQQVYTMGTNGDFNTSRPTVIQEARVGQGPITDYTPEPDPDPEVALPTQQLENTQFELPIRILNVQEFADIVVKPTPTSLISAIYLEGTYPLERIVVWPVPIQVHYLILYSLKPLSIFDDADDEIQLPPGYDRALAFNLAMEVAPEYGKEPSSFVERTAAKSKAFVERSVKQPLLLKNDTANIANRRGTWNWRTGQYQ